MRYLIFILLLACGACHADAIARQGANWVRVTALPCKNDKVVAAIQEARDDPLDYRAASAHYGGEDFAACWRPMTERRMFYLRYEDGDTGLVPLDDMKPVPEV